MKRKIRRFRQSIRLPKLFSSAIPGLEAHGRNFQLTTLASLTHTGNQAAEHATKQQNNQPGSNKHKQ
jgi:hypothetical protein